MKFITCKWTRREQDHLSMVGIQSSNSPGTFRSPTPLALESFCDRRKSRSNSKPNFAQKNCGEKKSRKTKTRRTADVSHQESSQARTTVGDRDHVGSAAQRSSQPTASHVVPDVVPAWLYFTLLCATILTAGRSFFVPRQGGGKGAGAQKTKKKGRRSAEKRKKGRMGGKRRRKRAKTRANGVKA